MDGELIPTEPSGPIPPAVGTDEVAFNSTVARASRELRARIVNLCSRTEIRKN